MVAGGLRLNGLGFWQTGSTFTVLSSVTQTNGLATINLPTITVDRPNLAAPIKTSGSLNQFSASVRSRNNRSALLR